MGKERPPQHHTYAANADWRRRNPEKRPLQTARHYKKHREELLEKQRIRRLTDPRVKERVLAKRVRLKEAGLTARGTPFLPKRPPRDAVAYQAAYKKAHPGARKAIQLRYAEKHREEIRAKHREYSKRPEVKEYRTLYLKKYKEANGNKIRERNEKWARNNPEKRAATKSNRRAREQSSSGSHTAKDLADLYAKQHEKCAACKAKISNKPGPKRYHIDHVMPIKRGGSNDISNLQLLCATCNRKKSAKHPDDWAHEHGLLFC